MNKNKNLEELLADALTPNIQPSDELNRKILQKVRDKAQIKETMKNKRKRNSIFKSGKAVMAAIAAVVLTVSSVTAYAAWQYLTPQEAAKTLKDKRLSDAFSGVDAVIVNETQTYGDYRATLVGIVSGKKLTDYATMTGNEVRADRSYWLMAIEHADGTPMPESSSPEHAKESFLTSPFIQGLNPKLYNIYTFSGNYSEFVQDGILYRMAECDNLELFADKEVYLCLTDKSSASVIEKAYNYDKTTGKITRNEEYDGCNALFILPLDEEKADSEKAKDYLKSLDRAPDEKKIKTDKLDEFVEMLTIDNIESLCEKKEGSEAVIPVDWNSDWVEISTAGEDASSGGMTINEFKLMFPDRTPRIGVLGYDSAGTNGKADIEITVLRMNEDGTITCAQYIPKNPNLQVQ